MAALWRSPGHHALAHKWRKAKLEHQPGGGDGRRCPTVLAELVAAPAGRPEAAGSLRPSPRGRGCPSVRKFLPARAAILLFANPIRSGRAWLRRANATRAGCWARASMHARGASSKRAWPMGLLTPLRRPARTCCSAWKRLPQQAAPTTGCLRSRYRVPAAKRFSTVGIPVAHPA